MNLLFLASPIYLVEVYNRVIPSGSIPTLVFWRDGAVIDRQVGAAGEHVLAGRIDALLASG